MSGCKIELPSVPDVTMCLSDCEPLHLGSCEDDLAKELAAEEIAQSSTPILYFRQDRLGTTWDPVYNEPRKLAFRPGLVLPGRVQKPEKQVDAGERGQKTRWDAVLWLAVATWPNLQDPPREGDVVGFWDVPYFRKTAVANETIPAANHYYDVIRVDTDGHVNMTATFVAWEITLVRRTEFAPERRLSEIVP